MTTDPALVVETCSGKVYVALVDSPGYVWLWDAETDTVNWSAIDMRWRMHGLSEDNMLVGQAREALLNKRADMQYRRQRRKFVEQYGYAAWMEESGSC